MSALFFQRHPDWADAGRDWPNRQFSRFVGTGSLRWHVQRAGAGPRLLLLHGTGAATHSWRDLLPLLAGHFDCLAPDLPGHGFTAGANSGDLGLAGMALRLGQLLRAADFEPDCVVGHSAGVAVAIRMALDGQAAPRRIVGLNAALKPMQGAAIFAPLAKLLFLNPLAPRLFSWRAMGQDATRRLLAGTGSQIEPRGVELYQRLFRHSGHVAGTLGMMAHWDLDRLMRDLSQLSIPLTLVAARGDRAVPAADSIALAARLANADVVLIETGGHLLHEESPGRIANLIVDLVRADGLLGESDL